MTNVNGFLKENEDVVTLLRAVEREQSTKTVMLRVDTSVLRGLASKPFSISEEYPLPHRIILDGRQSPYLLE